MSDYIPPTKQYLRRGEVIEWITSLGIFEKDFEKLVNAGVIERITLHANARGYYLREAIERHLIKPFRDAEERMRGPLPTTTKL